MRTLLCQGRVALLPGALPLYSATLFLKMSVLYCPDGSPLRYPIINTISLCGSPMYTEPLSVMTTSSSKPMYP